MDRIRGSALCLFIVILIVTIVVATRDNGPTESSVQQSTLQLQIGPVDGFASSASCKDCHPKEHASWHQSFS